jgi:iron complex transport system substrate-binding protein
MEKASKGLKREEGSGPGLTYDRKPRIPGPASLPNLRYPRAIYKLQKRRIFLKNSSEAINAPIFGVILIAIVCLFLSGCGNDGDSYLNPLPGEKTLSVEKRDGWTLAYDQYDRPLALVPKSEDIPKEISEKFTPERIIRTPIERLVVASGTYDPGIILELGEGASMIGSVDPPGDWRHPTILDMYRSGQIRFVGTYNALDFELIKILDPDLILVSSLEAKDNLENMGFHVAGTYDPSLNTVENRLNLMVFLGAMYGKEDFAMRKGDMIRADLEEINLKTVGLTKPKVGWGIYFNRRVYAIRGNFWMAELIKNAGGDYLFDYLDTDAMEVTLEEFITRSKDSDIFFANPLYEEGVKDKKDFLVYHPDLSVLKAFTSEGTVVAPKALTWQDTGNLTEIALDVAAIIHPELYPEREITYFDFLE